MILYKLDPLELPEIFMRVGEFLCPLSLTRSLLVSRAWYQVLLPLVWSYEITPFSLDLHAWEQHEEDTQQQQQQRWGRRQEKSHELPQRQQPTRDAIRKHNLLIRNLVLAYDDAIHIGISTQDPKRNFSFPHLTTLRLFENTLVPSRVLQVEFIQQHRATLKDVVIGGTHVGELLDTLASCPCLERLTVFEPLVFEDQSAWLSQLKRLWFRLRVVELYGPWYEANDSSSSSSSSALSSPSVAGSTPITSTISVPLLVELPERASRIQDLSMRVSRGTRFEAQLGMIAQSPDLVKLAWTFDISKYMSEEEKEHLDRTAPVRNLVEMMTTNRSPQPCQRLQELALPYAAFRNEEFSTLLHSMRLPLTGLDLSNSGSVDATTWKILYSRNAVPASPHHSQGTSFLRTLDFQTCPNLPGSAIHDMMCCLPTLEVLRADIVRDKDILRDPRPWICLRLRELDLRFYIIQLSSSSLPSSKLSLSPSQALLLSRLSKLRRLQIWRQFAPMDEEKGLPVPYTLWDGLDLLKDLQQLCEIDDSVLHCGDPELQWMTEKWPQLQLPVKTEGRWCTTSARARVA